MASVGPKRGLNKTPYPSRNGIVHIDIEPDQDAWNIEKTRYQPHSPKHRSVELYNYHEIPHFLQGNPYITSGYRVNLSRNMCYKSLLVWSNETLNTWTHLIGLCIFCLLFLYDNLILIPRVKGSLLDHFVLSAGLLCFQFCMACSTGYHLFRCHSERANRKWLAYDLTGISIGLLGCYLPGVHYAFYCLSVWRDIYLMVITGLFAAVLFYQTQTRYYSEAWFNKRIILYCGLTAYGVVPTLHWIVLNGGPQATIVQMFAPKVLVVYLLGMLAFIFYMSKAPESCWPGQFDYIGSSHQIWHVIVVLAFLWWHQSGLELLKYRMENSC